MVLIEIELHHFLLGSVVKTFNPSTWNQRQVDLCESKASLVYRASSRAGREKILHRETLSQKTNNDDDDDDNKKNNITFPP